MHRDKGTPIEESIRAWFEGASPGDAPAGFDRLLGTWGERPVCEALLRDYHDKAAELANKVCGAKALQARPRPVKTIGAFFFRMHTGGTERVLSILTSVEVQ